MKNASEKFSFTYKKDMLIKKQFQMKKIKYKQVYNIFYILM